MNMNQKVEAMGNNSIFRRKRRFKAFQESLKKYKVEEFCVKGEAGEKKIMRRIITKGVAFHFHLYKGEAEISIKRDSNEKATFYAQEDDGNVFSNEMFKGEVEIIITLVERGECYCLLELR